MLGKAIPAIDRAALRGLERNRGLFPAGGANGGGFNPSAVLRLIPLGLALFAPFGLIFKVFAGIKLLFASREYKFGPAIDTHKRFVRVFHSALRLRY